MTVCTAFLALHFLVSCSVRPATASRVLLGISPGWKFAGKSTGMRIFRAITESSMLARFSGKRCLVEISTGFPFGQGTGSNAAPSANANRCGFGGDPWAPRPKHSASTNSGYLLDPPESQTHRMEQEARFELRRVQVPELANNRDGYGIASCHWGAAQAHSCCKGSRGLPLGWLHWFRKRWYDFRPEVENLANKTGFTTSLFSKHRHAGAA
jgi:hypothetical protein